MIKYILALLVILLWSNQAFSMGFISPSEEIRKIAQELAYDDFPKASDIFTIIRIESAFNPKAVNGVSNGVMQVNHAPFDIRRNMQQGVAILREYYLITKSKEGAIKAYNVGIGTYLKGHLIAAQNDYYSKFQSQRGSYEKYQERSKYITRCFNCGNGIPLYNTGLFGYATSNLLAFNR